MLTKYVGYTLKNVENKFATFQKNVDGKNTDNSSKIINKK
jgi:hypothetical protein